MQTATRSGAVIYPASVVKLQGSSGPPWTGAASTTNHFYGLAGPSLLSVSFDAGPTPWAMYVITH